VVGALLLVLLIAGLSLVASVFVVRTHFVASVYPSVLVDLVNEERAERDAEPLAMSETLTDAAQMKVSHMLDNDYFAHYSPSGVTPWHWFDEAGYSFRYAGENLAMDFERTRPINEAWMDSPAHRDNIVSDKFDQIGIAAERGEIDGEKTTVVVQLFGTPLATQGQPSAQTASVGTAPPSGVPEFEVIEETETFRAVKNVVATPTSATTTVQQTSGVSTPWYIGAVVNPARTATYIFMTIAALLVAVLCATIVVEVRKQHPRHIAQGGLLLIIVISFAMITTNVAEMVHYQLLVT